jgi:hypothetical protein
MFVKLNPVEDGFKEEKMKERLKEHFNLDHYLK